MKQFWTILVFGVALILAACGTNSHDSSINGNWTAALMSSPASNSPTFNFSLSLTEMSGGNLNITNLKFTSDSPCFASGTTASGGFTLSGTFSGVTSGGFQMNIQSTGGSNNQLTLTGTVNNNTITGNWQLAGSTSGCSGSGTFTMNKS